MHEALTRFLCQRASEVIPLARSIADLTALLGDPGDAG
jgi:hypothetical protein